DGPAALGFALALAGARAKSSGKAIVFLALAHEARRGGSLYGRSLSAYGVTLSSLVLAFARDVKQLLWAAEEAARSGDVGALVIEGPGAHPLLDLTASRRLQLAAASSGAAAILIRTMTAPEPSAAEIRWRVAPALSGPRPYDAKASGNPRWRVEIERCRKGGRGAFLAEFRHEDQRLALLSPLPLFHSLAPRLVDRSPEGTCAGRDRCADGSL
ncbi:MAG TPA: hypothetical protein VNH64_04695, partial [Parvularculaceae bacterium]|nr:hypothetical protein [Parvularculaceae bacterium]